MSEKDPTPHDDATNPPTSEETPMDEQDRTPDQTPDPTPDDEPTTVLEARSAAETADEPAAEPAESGDESAEELAAAIREPFSTTDAGADDRADDRQAAAWASARAAYHGPAEDRPRSRRHPVNVGHLVMGLAFAGLVGIWALVVGDVVDNDDIRWLLPIPWVLAGAAGLLATTLGGRHRRV